jgi:tetratricopeptide (TPR) repeat protein
VENNNRGVVRYLKADMSGAISVYDRSIKINPRYVEAHCNRGAAKRANGDVEGAIADYSAAIGIDPGHTPAYLNRGLARLLQSKLAEAQLDFEQCLKLDRSLEPLVAERIKLIRQQLASKREGRDFGDDQRRPTGKE